MIDCAILGSAMVLGSLVFSVCFWGIGYIFTKF